MRQAVKVVSGYSRGYVEVELIRAPACGGGCESCSGCYAPKVAVRVRARGGEGAKPGDTVIIESAARRILGLAALVYLLPLVLFFAGYAVSALTGGLGFALGIGLLVPANRFAEKKELYRVIP